MFSCMHRGLHRQGTLHFGGILMDGFNSWKLSVLVGGWILKVSEFDPISKARNSLIYIGGFESNWYKYCSKSPKNCTTSRLTLVSFWKNGKGLRNDPQSITLQWQPGCDCFQLSYLGSNCKLHHSVQFIEDDANLRTWKRYLLDHFFGYDLIQ